MASNSHGLLKSTPVPGLKGSEATASDCLNQSDLKQVYKAVFEARAKWRRIGLELELAHGDLEAIDSRYRNPEDQLEQVLAKWLNRGEATWRQLSEALYSVPVGETALAKQIRMEHCRQDVPDLGVKRKHNDGAQQVESDISSMELEYARLSLNIRKSLKRREIHPQELSAFILSFQSRRGSLKMNGSLFISSCQQELNTADTIDAVFVIVSQFWSFLDYNLLENIVNEFGDDSDKEKFADYIKALQDFLSDWRVVPHKIQRSECPTTAVKLCFKLDSDSLPYRDIRVSIARIFKVHVENVLIESIENGCTKLVFLLPREVVALSLTAEQRKEIAKLTPSVLHVLLLDGCEEYTLFQSEKALATSPVDPTHETTGRFKKELESNVRQVKNVMGFDCEFLEPPPENLQTGCPVCLQIIREPYQVLCCGKKYCQLCIQTVKIKNKPCPTCNTEGFVNFPDTGHKQSLYSLRVHCSHQNDGCEWTGELRQLDEHLNTDPLTEKQLDGCLLTTINCDFHHVGCAVKLLRQDMPEHVRTSIHQHMSLLVTGHMTAHSVLENNHTNLEKDHKKLAASHKLLTKSHAKLVEEYVLLNDSHKRLKQEHESLSSNSVQTLCKYEELNDNYAQIKIDNQQMRIKIEVLEGLIQSPLTDPPRTETIQIVPSADIVMDNFEQHKSDDDRWYSPPVYTHPQGYKICLRVKANGEGNGKGTHVTVGVGLMKGEFDDSLKWPFRGSISIQLVDQNGQPKNEHIVVYDDSKALKYCNRVMYHEQAVECVGFSNFLAHNMLKKPLFNENQLIFMISGEVRV